MLAYTESAGALWVAMGLILGMFFAGNLSPQNSQASEELEAATLSEFINSNGFKMKLSESNALPPDSDLLPCAVHHSWTHWDGQFVSNSVPNRLRHGNRNLHFLHAIVHAHWRVYRGRLSRTFFKLFSCS